jgi:hypothetical protein
MQILYQLLAPGAGLNEPPVEGPEAKEQMSLDQMSPGHLDGVWTKLKNSLVKSSAK